MEAFDLFGDIAFKALATAAVLLAASLLAERVGVLIAALIITLPLNAGPGFLFVALEADGAFLAQGALVSFTATAAVHAYTTAFGHASMHLPGFWLRWGASLVAWLVIAAPLLRANAGIAAATVIVAAGFLLSHLLRHKSHDQTGAPLKAKRRGGLAFLIVRACMGGTAVALAATFAHVLGPSLTGLAFAFPVIMTANAWMLYRSYGGEFAAATITNSRKGLISYASFCYALAILPEYVGNLTAWTLAMGLSMVVTLAVFMAGRIRRRKLGR